MQDVKLDEQIMIPSYKINKLNSLYALDASEVNKASFPLRA